MSTTTVLRIPHRPSWQNVRVGFRSNCYCNVPMCGHRGLRACRGRCRFSNRNVWTKRSDYHAITNLRALFARHGVPRRIVGQDATLLAPIHASHGLWNGATFDQRSTRNFAWTGGLVNRVVTTAHQLTWPPFIEKSVPAIRTPANGL